MDHLAQSIKVIVLWQRAGELNKLVLKHQFGPFRTEQDIPRGFPEDCKRESRVVAPNKPKLVGQALNRRLLVNCRLPYQVVGQDVLGHVGRGDDSWDDLNRQPIIRLVLDRQVEGVDISTVDIAGLSSQLEGCRQAILRSDHVGPEVAWAHCLRVNSLGVIDVR